MLISHRLRSCWVGTSACSSASPSRKYEGSSGIIEVLSDDYNDVV
jgi:hypothetical protein